MIVSGGRSSDGESAYRKYARRQARWTGTARRNSSSRTGCLYALRGSGSKMEKQTTSRHRKSGRRGQCSLGSLGEHPEELGQGIERSRSVRDLDHFQRPDPAAALDRFPELEAVDCASHVLGHLIGRQQVPFAVEEAAEVEEGDLFEPAYRPVEGDLVTKLGALLAGLDFFENRVVLQQPVGVHCGRRYGVACADGGPSAISVFEVFQYEALLAGVEVLSVYDYAQWVQI